MTQKHQILKSASVISVITVVSRILGYLRDERITLLLGTSPLADAFVIAYRVPTVVRRLVGEGSLTATFIPVFSRYMSTGRQQDLWDFANRLFWTLVVALGVICTLGVVFSKQMVEVFTFFSPSHVLFAQAVALNRVMFPYIFFIGLAALAMAILNCFHIFGLPAATPIVLNICIVVFSFAALRRHFSNPAMALAVGVLIGGALQFLMQVPQLIRRGMSFHLVLGEDHPGVHSVASLVAPGFFGIGVAQINFLVDTVFATSSHMPEGSVTALYVAERVMELVLGGYAIAMATAILPMMSHQAAAGDYESLKGTLAFSLRIVSFITIPAGVGLMVLREPIIQVLFQHGQFMAESTELTTRALFYYAAGLPAFAAIKLIVPAFYSTHDTRVPAMVAGGALVLNILLNIVFVGSFYEEFGNGGPALATVAAAYFNFVVLFVIFRVRYGTLGTLHILASIGRIGTAAACMGFISWLMLRYSHFSSVQAFLPRLEIFAVLIAGAVAVYFAVAWALRCAEISEVYGIAVRHEAEQEVAAAVD